MSDQARPGGLAVDSYNHLQKCVELFDMNRLIGQVPKVELVRGDATKTIPSYLKENPQLIVSLLYLDFDILRTDARGTETFSASNAERRGDCV